jgi:hypothetical protein
MKNFRDFLENNDVVDDELDEDELSDAMWNFIERLDDSVIDALDEEQQADYVEIIETVAGGEDEEEIDNLTEEDIDNLTDDELDALDEGMPAKRVRRDVIQKRKASREHRKVKAKKKLAGRRKRKTAGFKRYTKKAKRLGKRGLTSTGKRKRTYINKG